MKNLIYILFVFCAFNSLSQNKVELLNEGNIKFNNKDFLAAEQLYKQSLEKDSSYYKANVNLAHSLYKQERFDESTSFYKNALELTDEKSATFYNLGNSQLREGKVEESIESYKNTLRIDPNNMNAKRNLAIAQSLLKEQEKEEKKEEEEEEEKEEEEEEEEEKKEEPKKEPKDEISKDELEQILKALERKELEVQEDLQKKKVVGKSKNLKDW